MTLRRLWHVLSAVFGKQKVAAPLRQQYMKYSRNSTQADAETGHALDYTGAIPWQQDLDYNGPIPWLQFIVNEDGKKFLANLSEEQLKEKEKWEVLIEFWRAEGQKMVPDILTVNDWKILLKGTNSDWEKTFYLEMCHKRQERIKASTERNIAVMKSISQPHDDEDLNLIQKSVALRKHLNQWNGIRSLQYGRPIVVDMDYEYDEHETFLTYKQIELMYKFNCHHIQPCHLLFTSAYRNQLLERSLCTGRNMLADFYEEDLLDVFPKERLFYLVPEGPPIDESELKNDQILVLGGVGGTKVRRRSYAKAVSLGIPFGSIPLDKYVSLKERSTVDLYLPHVLNILLDLDAGDSWKTALDRRLPDKKFIKYPGLVGPVPDKRGLRSYKQFSKLDKILKLRKR